MKSIILHGPATDLAGNFCDAGRELTIGDEGEGVISADAAAELVESGRAVDAAAPVADEFGHATVADLRKIAEDENIDLADVTRKDDIKTVIREARAVKASFSGQEPLAPEVAE